MDKITSKWNSFSILAEQNQSQILDENLKKIYDAMTSLMRNNATVYSTYSNEATRALISFQAFQQQIAQIPNFISVLSQYKIDSFLGAGGIGLAFSLQDPHENYILKLQIIREIKDRHLIEKGSGHNKIVFDRQQNNVYGRNEANILEAFPDIKARYNNNRVIASIFVLSKLQERGKFVDDKGEVFDLDELKKDFFKYVAVYAIQQLSFIFYFRNVLHKNINEMPQQIKVLKMYLKDDALVESVIRHIESNNPDDALRIVYGALKSVFKIITEDLFVRFGLVVYENALDTIKNDVGRDQHGGNYAFRPNSLEMIPFDI